MHTSVVIVKQFLGHKPVFLYFPISCNSLAVSVSIEKKRILFHIDFSIHLVGLSAYVSFACSHDAMILVYILRVYSMYTANETDCDALRPVSCHVSALQ